ncbi:MAG: M20/M25/M40 family metallo-hydrolase [Dehalococcoidia bacterium]
MDQQRLVQTVLELISIDSPTGEEDAIAADLTRRLEALGGRVQRDAFGNLIAALDGEGTPFLLSAHMDTVEPGRGIKPIIDGDRIHTDGSTILGGDPKAGVAAIIEAITAIRAAGRPHRAIEVVLTRGEESGLVGSRNLDYRLITAREGIVLDGEGAVNEITDAAPAQYFADIEIRGRAAHAGVEPEKGISAIRIAAELILALPQGRLDPETTANVGLVSGGSARNAVPERASITGEFRSRNPETLDILVRQYESSASDIRARNPEAEINLTLTKVFDGYRLAGEHPVIAASTAALAAIGLTPRMHPSGGATDANIFAGHGIAAAVLGLGGNHFHTVREDLSITNMLNGARFIEALLTAS